MVEPRFVSDALWKGQGALGGESQGKTLPEDEQRVNPKELKAMTDGGGINLAAHCGDNKGGSFFHSLAATDVFTCRTGAVPLLAGERSLVVKGLEAIARQLPFSALGIDSDSYGVLINDTFTEFCADQGIDLTRSRACRKQDQAWVRQKNGAGLRRFPSHERHSKQVAIQTMDHLHGSIRLHVNFFRPSFKSMEKIRKGSVETRRYTSPATSYERLIQRETVGAEAKASMNERRAQSSPAVQLEPIRETQPALVGAASPEIRATPIGESLERSLARVSTGGVWMRRSRCGRRRCEPRAISERGKTIWRVSDAMYCGGCRKTRTQARGNSWTGCSHLVRTGSKGFTCGLSS